MRHLRYVIVETGPCQHCGRDAGDHSVEGLCYPGGTRDRDARAVELVFRAQEQYAFIDLDSAEVRAWIGAAAA